MYVAAPVTLIAPDTSQVELAASFTETPTGAHGIALVRAEIGVPGRHLTLEDRQAARGAIRLPGRTKERAVELRAVLLGRDRTEANELRRQLLAVVRDHGDDPLLCRFTPESTLVELTVDADEDPVELEQLGAWAYEATIRLVAADPVMYEVAPTVGVLTAPATPVEVTNAGDTDVWPTLTVQGPASGTSTKVRVTNQTTGRFVEVDGITLTAGQELVFDFTPGAEQITIGGVSQLGKRAAGSRLSWPLVPGANDVQFTQTGGSGAQTGAVEFRSGWVS